MSLTVDIRKQMGAFRLDVNFEAREGITALLGASGCGKSVTLRCIAGILTPDEGRIVLDGVTLFDSGKKIDLPPQKRQVGYLFQQYALFPNMTVRQNIAAAVRDRKERACVTEDLLRRFRLEDVADKRPSRISGGQQQRCALARILASGPKTVLLDEPFSALDSHLKQELELELSRMLDDFGGTILWVSHDRGEVFRNCARVCVLDAGRSQGTYTLRELFHRPESEAAARLSGCENLVKAVPAEGGVHLPQWGLTLHCGKDVPEPLRCAGIRARHVVPAREGEENSFPCRVERVVQDVFAAVVLLRPESAEEDAPLLRMELEREVWAHMREQTRLTVRVQPRDILLLK